MTRRQFLKTAGWALAGCWTLGTIGCVAPKVSPSVQGSDDPAWQCGYCGHLTRSSRDLSGTRCPRCMRRNVMERISEESLKELLD